MAIGARDYGTASFRRVTRRGHARAFARQERRIRDAATEVTQSAVVPDRNLPIATRVLRSA